MNLNFTRKKLTILIAAVIIIGAVVFLVVRKGSKNVSLDLSGEKSAVSEKNNPSSDTNYGQPYTPPTEEIVDENGEKTTVNVEDLDPNNINTNTDGKNMFAHITTEHCNSDCDAFANKLDYFEYCQQVCGITPVKNVSGCDGKEGLEKDYCLKDLGVTKSDTSICDKIDDANVKKTCKNRIAQDLIEEQMSQPSPE